MHEPVMLEEVLSHSQPAHAVKRVWDATFGRGGHTRAFLREYPDAVILASDRDPEAIAHGRREFAAELQAGRIRFKQWNFHDFQDVEDTDFFQNKPVDVMLLDLGVSSPQLDQAERGFSFYHDGPLDMRMDPGHGIPASEVVNTWTEVALQGLFNELGEISRPLRVVKAIIARRREKPFLTTGDLAAVIERAEGWHKKGRHPATQYFLALRLLVNDELGGVKNALPLIVEKALGPGGRALVITFHSLEDRIVKYIFKEREDLGRPVNKKVIVPGRPEILRNPRSRSAKLRVFERGTIANAKADI